MTRAFVLLLILASCKKEAAPAKTEPPPKPTAACASKADEFDRVLAAATRACATDQDCACFHGGISKTDPCGGITDAKTNAKLEAIAKDWSSAGCANEGVMCAAMVCDPVCNEGSCGPRHAVVQ